MYKDEMRKITKFSEHCIKKKMQKRSTIEKYSKMQKNL